MEDDACYTYLAEHAGDVCAWALGCLDFCSDGSGGSRTGGKHITLLDMMQTILLTLTT